MSGISSEVSHKASELLNSVKNAISQNLPSLPDLSHLTNLAEFTSVDQVLEDLRSRLPGLEIDLSAFNCVGAFPRDDDEQQGLELRIIEVKPVWTRFSHIELPAENSFLGSDHIHQTIYQLVEAIKTEFSTLEEALEGYVISGQQIVNWYNQQSKDVKERIITFLACEMNRLSFAKELFKLSVRILNMTISVTQSTCQSQENNFTYKMIQDAPDLFLHLSYLSSYFQSHDMKIDLFNGFDLNVDDKADEECITEAINFLRLVAQNFPLV